MMGIVRHFVLRSKAAWRTFPFLLDGALDFCPSVALFYQPMERLGNDK